MGFIQTSSSGQIVNFRKNKNGRSVEFFFTTFNIWASACGCVYTAVLYICTYTHNDERRAYLEIWKVSTAVTSKWRAAPSFSLAASFRRVPPLFVYFQVIFFNFLFFSKRKKNTHTYLKGRRRKMAFTKLFVTIQKQRPRVKRKRRKKNVRNRLLSRLSFVRGGETLLVCAVLRCGSFFFFCWMYLFSFNPLFKKYLFLFVLFETCPPFNFPAGVFFWTFNIHRWLHSAKKP